MPIVGKYPCCKGELWIDLEDEPILGLPKPLAMKEECPHCGATVWHWLSRFDAKSWTEEEFLKEFDVNEETAEVKPKENPDAKPSPIT